MTTDLALIEDGSLPMLVGDPDLMVEQAASAARALKKVVDQAGLSRKIGNGEHLEFEAWQTVGHFYGTTASIEWSRPLERDGALLGYEARAVALRHGLQVGAAEAFCAFDEPTWKGKPEFQVRSMAQTRAMAKALRSVLSFVVVLAGYRATPAEEMIGVADKQAPAWNPPAPSDPPFCLACADDSVEASMIWRFGEKNGKKWSAWMCPEYSQTKHKSEFVGVKGATKTVTGPVEGDVPFGE